jgi:1-acyl-sn-glycerol-3-phosphate acyltransferase
MVLSFRRKRSPRGRITQRGRESRKAASQLDLPWARTWIAGMVRETFLRFVLTPLLNYYTRRRAAGREMLASFKGPVILVANHTSHIDTPVILAALPRKLRRRTAVVAAADYFYRNKLVASLVSLIFNTVPIDRRGAGLSKQASRHLDRLIDRGWNLLVYPEGTRSRNGGPGRVRRGAAVLASRHKVPVVPIRLSGTAKAMPPGRFWPKRLHGKLLSKRHRIEISFGEPIPPAKDPTELARRVQTFFEQGGDKGSTPTLRQRLARSR